MRKTLPKKLHFVDNFDLHSEMGLLEKYDMRDNIEKLIQEALAIEAEEAKQAGSIEMCIRDRPRFEVVFFSTRPTVS